MRYSLVLLAICSVFAGQATLFAGDFEFLRGDVNGDGRVHPLVDAHYLLAFSTAGGAAPPCSEAADVDDDGIVHAVLDSIALFSWAYIDGDTPADPGTEECGVDPGNSDPDCGTAPACEADDLEFETNEDYLLEISEGFGEVGDAVLVTLSFTNDGDDVLGMESGVCHDSEVVSIQADDIVAGEDHEAMFAAVEIRGDEGWTFGFLHDVHGGESIEPDGEAIVLYEMTYLVDEEGDSDLVFCSILDDYLVEPRVLIASEELVLPDLQNGSIQYGTPPFLRGDVDGNGEVVAIVDAIALLEWGFADGAEPGCRDSADVDDDGVTTPLLDTLFLLSWGFTGGDAPPSPGTDECGSDATDDALSCLIGAAGCL